MNEPFKHHSNSRLILKEWSELSPGLIAGFTTKNGGISGGPFHTNNLGLHVNDNSEDVAANRRQLAEELGFPLSKWACADQIHQDQIVKVTEELTGFGTTNYDDSIKGTDAFYTNKKNILLTLCYADCVPVYFYAPEQGFAGIAHAGWKGTVKNIAGKMVQLWEMTENIPAASIHAAIGPSIDSCCYIVDDRVVTQVDEALENCPATSTAPYEKISEGQYRLDLKTVNKLLLLQAGVREENIHVSTYCTSCQNDLFFSHRRDKGKTGRMLSFIGVKDEQ
ncbi:peptidoglycan editing factor PgeF [Salipaludibacillus aurantiacus]|uniref:Purine nucleoside phosphorylase n=1 Tax=Salipaludibacillus aurantiacus TaxID=1601833 RepID=A0A1H9RSG5_9BACI|nr:peptidoglycan editing factor PgeF [Salipaludibacillus aurantiacus]SER75534.1 conserved hypothetical protein [Salipaludibacillus aurantiacus]